MLDHLDASGRYRAAEAGDRRAARRHQCALAKQALAMRSGCESKRSRRSGTGMRPPSRAVRLGRGRGEQPTRRDVPVFRPFMLAHALDDTRCRSRTMRPSGNGTGIRVQLVHAGGQTRLYSRTGDDVRTASRCRGGVPNARRARRRAAGARAPARAADVMAAPQRASTRSSRGSAQESSARDASDYPPSSGCMTCCSTAGGPARAALAERGAAGAASGAARPERSTFAR
jgi:DNA ligase-1